MRPRKSILLINDREQECNCWHLVFESAWTFRVTSGPEMPWELHEIPEVAVIRGSDLRRACTVLRQLLPETRILAITDSRDVDADVKLPAAANMYAILPALKTLAVRKPGPKKGCVAAVPVIQSIVPLTDGMREAG